MAELPPDSGAPVSAKDNPYATVYLERIPFRFPSGMTWELLMQRLQSMQWCASIVGGHGRGKTTLLEQLLPRLKQQGFDPRTFVLRTESTNAEKDVLTEQLRAVEKPGLIVLDGAEQLSTARWLGVRSAASKAAGFLITVHRTSRLPVVLNLESNVSLLKSLVEELTGGSLPAGEAHAIFQRHYGNLRDCFRELYDRYAG